MNTLCAADHLWPLYLLQFIIIYLLLYILLYIISYQGRSDTHSNQAFEGVKLMTLVKASEVFWCQIFYSRECHTTNATVGDLSNTRVLLLVNKIYATENKHLLGIYAVVNQVTLRPKEIIHMFVA